MQKYRFSFLTEGRRRQFFKYSYSILVCLFLISSHLNLSAQIKVITDGKVGIGTFTPEEQLHVEGVIRSTVLANLLDGSVCADQFGNLILCDSSPAATEDLDLNCHDILDAGNINFCNGGSLSHNPDGILIIENLPLITDIDASTLDCESDIPIRWEVNGATLLNGCLYIASDQRFKKEITPFPNALSKINQINAYSYQYNQAAFPDYSFQKGKTYGFLAQEVGKIAPELVQKSKKGYYSVNYIGMIPLLSQAIKEQQLIIEHKVAETQELQDNMKKLTLEVAELKDLVQAMSKE